MKKKLFIATAALLLIGILAACASLKLPGSSQSTTGSGSVPAANGTPQPGRGMDLANQPLENKLAVGTLSLEGTDLAVTAEQARALLPLWKAVRSLGSNNNASQEEMNALYAQIKETMTADQIKAIEEMKFTQEEMSGLMEKLGISFGQGRGGNLTESERATRVAQFQSQGGVFPEAPGRNGNNGGNRSGGDMPPGGGPMPGGGAIPGGGFDGGMPGAQGTTTPGANMTGRIRMGIENMFIEPLIQTLQERAGAGK